MKQRKIPLRRCTGCMEMKEKNELVRVVHNDSGEFFLDITGKKNGRGAYICKNVVCMEKAVKSKGLQRSFSCAVPAEIYDILKEQLLKEAIKESLGDE